jgi:hypothetical protein
MSAELDVMAPGGDFAAGEGVLLPSANSNQSFPPSEYLYAFIQGTSFACPHVAGALAIMAMVEPSLDLETARTLLQRSGSNLDDPLAAGLFNVGILNVASLIELHLGGRIATSIERPLFRVAQGGTAGEAGAGQHVAAVSAAGAPEAAAHAVNGASQARKDQTSLIVQLMDSGTAGPLAGSVSLEQLHEVRAVRGSTNYRLVRLQAGTDLETARDLLLAQPGIRAVYYNYRYRPL